MNDTKTCRSCMTDKPTTAFHKNATSKDGLQSTCKECRAKYSAANSKQISEYRANLYQANRGKEIQKATEWKENNRPRYLATLVHNRAYKRGYGKCKCCTREEIISLLESRPAGWHADHIVSAKDGGNHCRFNLQFLTPSEHYAKTIREVKQRKIK